jgi:uncharacterized membrane protein YdbT with pleckstrin-like domain
MTEQQSERPQDLPEGVLWQGSPAQLTNIWRYLGSAVLIAVLIAAGVAIMRWVGGGAWPLWIALILSAVVLLYALWHYLQTRYYQYELTNQRLRIRIGVLNRQTHELELYRVHDISMNEPFWYRLFGLGNIVLYTSDETNPELTIRAIAGAQRVRDQIREHVEKVRQQKRVRTIEGFGE